ncbi:MAG: CoA pyrophosphatase [Planctomycetota bacterium]|nr:CoA pyrophosphatase [Planctomycetota bacterium]
MLSPDHLAIRLARAAAEGDRAPIPAEAPTAAVAAILHWRPTPHVLLMQRAAHPADPWSGQVSMPGGRNEDHDASLLHTAQRETHEELGIDLSRAHLLGGLAPTQAMARGKRLSLFIQPFVFEVSHAPEPRLNHEAAAAFWLPLAEAAVGELDHQHRYQDDQRTLLLPAWRFDDRVVWGLTYRMLAGLLDLAR